MIWAAMEHGTVIAENVKALYHALTGRGVSVRFSEMWDVGQAAFLLDPLARDRSLMAPSGDMNEGAEPALQMARLMRVYAQQKELMAQDTDLQRIAKEFDFPVIWLFQIERRGMKLDTAMLARMGEELRAELRAIEREMYTLVGYEFNAASPVQLSEVLFTKLQLSRRRASSVEKPSTDRAKGAG